MLTNDDILIDERQKKESLGKKQAEYYRERFGVNYVFEWPEGLSCNLRKNAGIKLYNEIKKLQKNKIYIDTVLCHSHGGNVLVEAVLHAKSCNDSDFSIKHVIFYETPIYEVTEKAVAAKNKDNEYYIKNMYNFVAANDLTQVIDFITSHFPFAKRFFEQRKDNLMQYKINNVNADHNSSDMAFSKIKMILQGELEDSSFETVSDGRMGCIQSFFYNHSNKIIFLGFLYGVYCSIHYYFFNGSDDKKQKLNTKK